ncbi:tubby-like F-box protein 3 isoform X2 [Tanacetum coccineum]
MSAPDGCVYLGVFLADMVMRVKDYARWLTNVLKPSGEDTPVLRMRGLPFSAGKDDIIDFFKEFTLTEDSIHITYNSEGRATGEAFVEFANLEDSKAALAKDRMTLGSRYIELFMSSPEELGDADTTVSVNDSSCWGELPLELLRDVLTRIEVSESTWPMRKNVVFAAGVCKKWRSMVKEIVGGSDGSGMFTFPSDLKQPGSVGSLTKCLIKRNRRTRTYKLYLIMNEASNDDKILGGKFLLAARRFRRAKCTDYIISFSPEDISEESSTYMGKSKFLGTKFTVYDSSAGSYPVSSISYEVNAEGPRMLGSISLTIAYYGVEGHYFSVTASSLKKLQLITSSENESGMQENKNVILQYGKVGKDLFTVDYQYPISAFQAFAICLSSFDTKLAWNDYQHQKIFSILSFSELQSKLQTSWDGSVSSYQSALGPPLLNLLSEFVMVKFSMLFLYLDGFVIRGSHDRYVP